MNRYLNTIKRLVVFIGLASALSFAGSVVAYPITVKLTADAEWLPEGSGVLLSTDKGYVHIYNENMNELGDAKKDECYVLEADTEDYVTLHADKYPSLEALDSQRALSSWTKVNCEPAAAVVSKPEFSKPRFSKPEFSTSDFNKLERWTLEVNTNEYMADGFDKVAAENDKYLVIYQNAGTSCAAGNHWLFNKEYKSYRSVSSGTCDDRDFNVLLKPTQLIFMSGNTITALYPIY